MHRIIIFLIIISNLFAIQATDQQIILEQPFGVTFNGYVRGDEWKNWYETIDGYTISKDLDGVLKYVNGVNRDGFTLSSIKLLIVIRGAFMVDVALHH